MIGSSIDENLVEPFSLALVKWYRSQPESALESVDRVFSEASHLMNEALAQYDVLLTPTIGTEPLKLGDLSPTLDRETLLSKTEQYAGYTPIHSICGATAMSVPLGMTNNGMPVGSHFAASAGSEKLLLELAYQLEEAKPWFDRKPKIC